MELEWVGEVTIYGNPVSRLYVGRRPKAPVYSTSYVVRAWAGSGRFAAIKGGVSVVATFDTEQEAKNYCEICCRMEVSNGLV